MSSVVQLVSDFVFTPYVLRQRHGLKSIPPPVTWCWWYPTWAACSFPLRQFPHDFSPQEICTSVSPNRSSRCVTFSSQSNNKLYFFLHVLTAFYEQASSRNSWLKAFLRKSCKYQLKQPSGLLAPIATVFPYCHQFHVPSSFFFWCLVQSGLFLFLKLVFYAIAQLPSLADIAV